VSPFAHLPSLGWTSQAGHDRCDCGAPLVPYSTTESDLVCYASGRGCCEARARRDPAYDRRRWRDPGNVDWRQIAEEVAWIRSVHWMELARARREGGEGE